VALMELLLKPEKILIYYKKWKVFELYENITDGRGLAFRLVYETTSLIKAIFYIIWMQRGYNHGFALKKASHIGWEILDRKI